MKNKLVLAALIISTFLGFFSCQDFIESDLKKKSITLLAPGNNVASSSSQQTFWWEDVKGAESYNLQIVKPNFNSVQQLVLDSTLKSNQFTLSLLPGVYQWRVRALNSSSYTDYVVYSLTIDSTLNLSSQAVILLSPAENYTTKNLSNTFSWQPLANADSYLFQVLSGSSVIHTQTSTLTNATYTFLAEGSYQWRILAQNSTSTSSSANSTRTIIIDITPPPLPVLNAFPNDTSSNPVHLIWTRDISAVSDSVYIYADSNLTQLVNSAYSTNQSYDFSGAVNNDYFWRLKSIDEAGNRSSYTVKRKFIIVP